MTDAETALADLSRFRPAKRLLDIVSAFVGIVLLSPVLLIVSVALVLLDGAPIFFRQTRAGLHGRHFELLKFRTMIPQSESIGPKVTVSGDHRITRTGRWLRSSKLDELPQLINVLKGEMSLVGPRPEVPEYVQLYSASQKRVLDFVPGITDPASLKFFNENELLAEQEDPLEYYRAHLMPEKLEINIRYSERATFWSDLWVVCQTIGRVFSS